MASYSTDRRSLLKIIGTIGATCAYPFSSDDLYGQTPGGQTPAGQTPAQQPDHHQPASSGQPAQPQFFNARDFTTIARVADLIIPATDTPGAIGAGVPGYIDIVVARNTDQQLVTADGLRWLDSEAARTAGKHFIKLTEAQQLSILEPLCAAHDADENHPARNVQFFALIKSLTADGYYTSRIGLIEELQYQGSHVMGDYPECGKTR